MVNFFALVAQALMLALNVGLGVSNLAEHNSTSAAVSLGCAAFLLPLSIVTAVRVARS